MTIMRGSIEILSGNGHTSEGIVVTTPDPDRLPEALGITRALEDFAIVDPPREGVDREWTARTHDGFTVEVLWRELRLEGPRP